MKKTSKFKKVLVALLASSMVFSLVGCDNEGKDDGKKGDSTTAATTATTASGGTTAATTADKASTADGEEKLYVVDMPEGEEFNFGPVAFNNRDFTIAAGTDIKVGGNRDGEGGGADDAIAAFGFQGYAKPDNGYPGDDPEGEWLTMISQNGEFWDNICRIEATFFLDDGGNDTRPEQVSNAEVFIQGGGLLSWDFWNPGENLISEFDEENGGDGFKWGETMTAVWDFDEYKKDVSERVADKFAEPVQLSDPNNPESDKKGGGVNKFGIMLGTDEILNDVEAKISWTDAKIYVHDLAKFNEMVEEVEKLSGKSISENTEGKVFEEKE